MKNFHRIIAAVTFVSSLMFVGCERNMSELTSPTDEKSVAETHQPVDEIAVASEAELGTDIEKLARAASWRGHYLSHYDNRDAMWDGGYCAGDAITVASKAIGKSGVVELRWSKRCGTNWTRVYTYGSKSRTIYAAVYRQVRYEKPDRQVYPYLYTDEKLPNRNNMWSRMVHAVNMPASGIGCINDNGWKCAYVTQFSTGKAYFTSTNNTGDVWRVLTAANNGMVMLRSY